MPIALISGITGQDGSYLAELLLAKGYTVHGLIRRTSLSNTDRINHLLDRVTLHEADMHDQGSLTRAIIRATPDEIYNLAAQSFVATSWDQPAVTADITGMGAVRIFEAVRQLRDDYGKSPRVYQASSSEMFGQSLETPQNEATPFKPHSPYGCAKLFAHEMARVYRDSFGLFIACGILFNHEGPRRGETFVTRKITQAVCEIIEGGRTEPLSLGNLDACRDWGYAGDYVEAMWLMLQQNQPEDFVIGTGVSHSVREFVEEAFYAAGQISDWEHHITINQKFVRPLDIGVLQADPTHAREVLGWEPKTSFEELVRMMVSADMARITPATLTEEKAG